MQNSFLLLLLLLVGKSLSAAAFKSPSQAGILWEEIYQGAISNSSFADAKLTQFPNRSRQATKKATVRRGENLALENSRHFATSKVGNQWWRREMSVIFSGLVRTRSERPI